MEIKKEKKMEKLLFILLSITLSIVLSLSIFVSPMYSRPKDKELCPGPYPCEGRPDGAYCQDFGTCKCESWFCVFTN